MKVQATHVISDEDLREWMVSYGIDIYDVKHASIEIGFQSGPNICAWLDVEFVKRNADGKPYAVHGSHESESRESSTKTCREAHGGTAQVVEDKDRTQFRLRS